MGECVALSAGTACRLSKFQMVTAWDCVTSLVSNSLASQATNVAVRLDLDQSELRFQVVDDGSGVLPSDMNTIGRQSWTGQTEDGPRGRGSSLAQLRSVSRCVTISSRFGDGPTMLAEFDKGLRKQVKREESERKCPGTTVTVYGYLWNMPVRRKLIKEISSLSVIKRALYCFSVLHPDVRFSLRNDTNGKRDLIINQPRHSGPLETFTSLLGPHQKGTFKELSWKSHVTNDRITGYVYSESHHNNLLQLLCVNQQPLLQSRDLQRHVAVKLKKWDMLKEKRIQHPIFIFFIEVSVVLVEEIQKMFNYLFGERDSANEFFIKSRAEDTLLGIKPLESSAEFCVKTDDKHVVHFSSFPISGARFSIPVIKSGAETTKKSQEELLFRKPVKLADDLSDWVNPNFAVHVNKFPMKLTLEREARRSAYGLKIKLNKKVMKETKVLGQVDDKFLASVSGPYLLLWDQHAVHERINLEFMINSKKLPDGKVRSHSLSSPFTVEMRTEAEVKAVTESPQPSSDWGVQFALTEEVTTLLVTDVPFSPLQLDTRRQLSLTTNILEELAALKLNGENVPSFPPALLAHLASKSCRGAIMFGDVLSQETCEQLVRDLGKCEAPFQCAHGRPSVSVVCELEVARKVMVSSKPNLKKLKCY